MQTILISAVHTLPLPSFLTCFLLKFRLALAASFPALAQFGARPKVAVVKSCASRRLMIVACLRWSQLQQHQRRQRQQSTAFPFIEQFVAVEASSSSGSSSSCCSAHHHHPPPVDQPLSRLSLPFSSYSPLLHSSSPFSLTNTTNTAYFLQQ